MPWPYAGDSATYDQSAIGARKCGAQSFDGALVDLTNFFESGEVVNEPAVDHAIRLGCSAAEAFQILQITPMHFGAGGGNGFGACIGTREPQHLIARADK